MPMDTGLYFSCQVGSLPLDTFDVTEFHLQEGLSELFTLSLTVVSHSDDIDMQSQLLQTAVLTITSDGDPLFKKFGIISATLDTLAFLGGWLITPLILLWIKFVFISSPDSASSKKSDR
ncbi:hypothetical protein [Hafnia paralvei]|uniref:Uncharacterized protein n=1 Tax=Hafnia paralvei TaxID=546367 RepID=A0A4Q9EE17_9GAMM|nr:hypothetical protein [Hafnia paralvei]TBM21433.1 hypothetical protein EYY89_20340 [Hafnia paralvei]